MSDNENMDRSRKLAYWLNYALEKFGSKFWKRFSEVYPGKKRYFSTLEMLAIYKNLSPLPAKKSQSNPQIRPISSQESNKALQFVFKMIALFEMESNISIAQEIVLAEHPKEEADQEVLKLAKQVSKNISQDKLGFRNMLARYTYQDFYLLEEFKASGYKRQSFFEDEWNEQRNLTLAMKWRHFFSARNYEKTIQQEAYSICKVKLKDLNSETDQLSSPNQLLTFYRALGNFIDAPNWTGFDTLTDQVNVFKQSGSLENTEMVDVLRLLINFLLRQLPSLPKSKLALLKDLYLENFNDELLLHQGQIHQRDFKSIISVLIRLGETYQARKLFEEYKNLIQDDENGSIRTYNQAVIQFYETKFEMAASNFMSVMHNSEDYYLKTDGKLYALRSIVALQVKHMDGNIPFFFGSDESFKVFYDRLSSTSTVLHGYYAKPIKVLLHFSKIWGEYEFEKLQKWHDLRIEAQALQDGFLASWVVAQIDQCIHFHSS